MTAAWYPAGVRCKMRHATEAALVLVVIWVELQLWLESMGLA